MYFPTAVVLLLTSGAFAAPATTFATSATPSPTVACGVNAFKNPQFDSTASWSLIEGGGSGTVTGNVQSQYKPLNSASGASTYAVKLTIPAGTSKAVKLEQAIIYDPNMSFRETFLLAITGSPNIQCTNEFYAGQGNFFSNIGRLPTPQTTPGSYWGTLSGWAYGVGMHDLPKVGGVEFVCTNNGAAGSVTIYLDQAQFVGQCLTTAAA